MRCSDCRLSPRTGRPLHSPSSRSRRSSSSARRSAGHRAAARAAASHASSAPPPDCRASAPPRSISAPVAGLRIGCVQQGDDLRLHQLAPRPRMSDLAFQHSVRWSDARPQTPPPAPPSARAKPRVEHAVEVADHALFRRRPEPPLQEDRRGLLHLRTGRRGAASNEVVKGGEVGTEEQLLDERIGPPHASAPHLRSVGNGQFPDRQLPQTG